MFHVALKPTWPFLSKQNPPVSSTIHFQHDWLTGPGRDRPRTGMFGGASGFPRAWNFAGEHTNGSVVIGNGDVLIRAHKSLWFFASPGSPWVEFFSLDQSR